MHDRIISRTDTESETYQLNQSESENVLAFDTTLLVVVIFVLTVTVT
jgi:hypothetical protein